MSYRRRRGGFGAPIWLASTYWPGSVQSRSAAEAVTHLTPVRRKAAAAPSMALRVSRSHPSQPMRNPEPPAEIAALYVETDGVYFGLPGVDPWDAARDARLYSGPHPVVAHPPCERWGDMWMGSPLVVARTGERKVLGDDDGCFAAAIEAVRKYGGVLEHPEGSRAWAAFDLLEPPRDGGWVMADWRGGWTCRVEQVAYGHVVRKPTWLYAVGCELPSLRWGVDPRKLPSMVQPSRARIASGRTPSIGAHGLSGRQRRHTPEPFRDLLIGMARSAARAHA